MREPELHSLSLKTWLSYYHHSKGRREAGQTQRCTQCYPGRMLVSLAVPGRPLGSTHRGVGWLCPPLRQPYPGVSLLAGRALPRSPQAWSAPTTCKLGWSVVSLLRSFTCILITLWRFQFPRTSGSACLPGLPRNSGPLQQHPDWAFPHQGLGCHLCRVGTVCRVSTTCPQGHTRLLSRLTATCASTHISAPGSWEKRGPGGDREESRTVAQVFLVPIQRVKNLPAMQETQV